MRLPRNPFRSSKVENLESQDLFLKLFQPLALGALGDNPWDSVQVIRSAQGGGKTSLFRVLTPECLRRVAEGTSPHLGDIAEQLRRIGAITDSRPTTLGIYIPLGTTPYATLARCKLDEQDPVHLFYALLDARVILTAVRGLQTLCGLESDTDIDRISFHWPQDTPNRLYEFNTTKSLVDWARTTERDIWRAIDRGEARSIADKGHARPYAFEALSQNVIFVDGVSVCDRVLVMIDDAHKLVAEQRKLLLEHVITARLSVSLWIAERMYAMEPYELLALDTASSSREYSAVVLSLWWQRATDSSSSKFYNELATKRLHEAGVEVPFDQLVSSSVDETKEGKSIQDAIVKMKTKLDALKEEDQRFSNIDLTRKDRLHSLDYLIELKAVDLYMSGIRSRVQTSFDFEASVPTPTSAELSSLKAVAEYQICIQNDLPLYYSAQTTYKIASWNVDQFLSIAATIFDQYDAQRVRNSGEKVTARIQDKLLSQVAQVYWAGLPKRMPGGESMQRFLQAFAKHALAESLAPTAKYSPGITGFGITSKDHERLRNCSLKVDADLLDFGQLLSSAVAHNVLFMRPDSKQGKAGETVTVFYLNRLLCVYLGLPIGLGGWWRRKVDHFASLIKLERGKSESGLTLFEDRKISK